VRQGGEAIDIFRLNMDGVNDWPKEDWWWPLIQQFADRRRRSLKEGASTVDHQRRVKS
tara:strand:- start:23 stop:196 length:174 start_codon:yes stop_codon:yes gene_type:complete